MAGDAKKIAAFTALLTENPNNWIAHHQQDLVTLQQQVGDDDEKNTFIIQEFLAKSPDMRCLYEDKLQSIKAVRSSSKKSDMKGIGGSQAQSNRLSQSLADLIQNAIKKPTKTPEENKKPDKK